MRALAIHGLLLMLSLFLVIQGTSGVPLDPADDAKVTRSLALSSSRRLLQPTDNVTTDTSNDTLVENSTLLTTSVAGATDDNPAVATSRSSNPNPDGPKVSLCHCDDEDYGDSSSGGDNDGSQTRRCRNYDFIKVSPNAWIGNDRRTGGHARHRFDCEVCGGASLPACLTTDEAKKCSNMGVGLISAEGRSCVTSAVTGAVLGDLDGDGLVNTTSPGFDRIFTVQLFASTSGTFDCTSGTPVATSQTTNNTGTFNLGFVLPGIYYLVVAPAEGYRQTSVDAGQCYRTVTVTSGSLTELLVGVQESVSGCGTNCPTSKGRQFVLAYSVNHPTVSANSQVFLTVASEEAATVNYTLLGTTTTLTLAANEIKSFQVNKSVIQGTPNQAQDLAVYITSDKDITVNGLHWSTQSAEGTWVLPTNALGTSYLVHTQEYITNPYFHIVTTDVPITDITVKTLVTSGFGPPGTYNITLGPFQSYLVYANNGIELSGTSVTGSSPFALFVGNRCALIPLGCIACDITWEQLPPTSNWGRKFLIGTLALTYNPDDAAMACATDKRFNVRGDVMRIMASEDNTVLTFNGGTTGPLDGLNNTWQMPTLNTGQVFQFTMPADTSAYITASKPVSVLQMMQGQGARILPGGDPAIIAVPPTNQWANNYYFDLGVSSGGLFNTGIINLMYIGTNAQGVQLASSSGTQIPITWIPASTPDLTNAQVARLQVAPGGYTVRHTNPAETVGAIIGAVAPFISYAYPAGMVFRT